eukprot:gene12777-14992_t
MSLMSKCSCSEDEGNNAIDRTYFIVFTTALSYAGFMALIFNMLFPLNAKITQNTTSEKVGTAYGHDGYGNGVAMDIVKVTTTTTHKIHDVEPLSKRFTRYNIKNILIFFALATPLAVMTYYMYHFANKGCDDCCVLYKMDDSLCRVESQKYLGSKTAWISFAEKELKKNKF